MSTNDLLKWMVEHWKPACAFIYTFICVFDFVVFPSWVGLTRLHIGEFIEITKNIDPEIRRNLLEYSYRQFIPYTLSNGGLFHLSFGALLTGAALMGAKTILADRRKDKVTSEEISDVLSKDN